MLADLQMAFCVLLPESATHLPCCSLVTDNPLADIVYTRKQAEAAVLFDICALAEIGNSKSNLIGVGVVFIDDLINEYKILW